MTGSAIPRAFYAVAVLSGVVFGVMAVSVPLHVAAVHRPASLAGEVLAAATLAVAFGAVGAGPLNARVGGGRNLLVASLVACGVGELAFMDASAPVAMALAATLVGAGIGVFWVGSQTLLGEASGRAGSERGFALHYAAYTLGSALGSTVAGGLIAGLRSTGADPALATRLSYGLGVAAAGAALLVWRPGRREPDALPRRPRLATGLTPRGVAMQLPDLMLVGALGLVLPMAPIVLVREFHLAPLLIGITVGVVQAGKIAGTLTARSLTAASGHRRVILLLLGCAATLSLTLVAAVVAGPVGLFVLVLVATAFVATGAWPLIVDSALARTEPARRPSATIAWNACEYGVIAAATVGSGWLLAELGNPQLLFGLAAALLAGAAACAAVVLRWPVHAPESARPKGATC